jgi:Ca-activated chloride channel homolog
MDFNKRLLTVLLALTGFVGPLLIPWTTPAQENQSDAPIKVQRTIVSVPVIVSDRQGRYVTGLKHESFKLYQDQIEQRIAIFDAAEEPLNVALLLDTSRSAFHALADVKKEAASFLKELRPKDRALVMSFDYAVHQLCTLTSDREALERAIKAVRFGNQAGTTLRDAVAEVIARQFKHIDGRKAIILLTDGMDTGSGTSEKDLLDQATESEAMIYSVFFFQSWASWASSSRLPGIRERAEIGNQKPMTFLTKLSDASAGRFYDNKVSGFKKTFTLIAEDLRHQYRLGFYPDLSKADGQRHMLRVEVSAPDAVVRARRSYQAPSFTK